MKQSVGIFILFILMACNQPNNKTGAADNTQSESKAKLSDERAEPKTTPVQQFEQKVKDDLNTNWVFRVSLYETKQRFTYQMKMLYEEVSGEMDITLPNLGAEPRPQIKKGDKDHECIIGFLDDKDVFREYKKVSIVDGDLKVTTLKSYAVSER